MEERIKEIFHESAETMKGFVEKNSFLIVKCVDVITRALREGNKVMFFGNGGSAADAQHLAGELVNRFMYDRDALAGIALTTDTSVLTCISNDSDFSKIFSRQIEAIGRKGDIAFGISTSGNSTNVLKAFIIAKEMGIKTIALTGNDGGDIKRVTDICVNVESDTTPRIQETHITIGHTICELVEQEMFPKG